MTEKLTQWLQKLKTLYEDAEETGACFLIILCTLTLTTLLLTLIRGH